MKTIERFFKLKTVLTILLILSNVCALVMIIARMLTESKLIGLLCVLSGASILLLLLAKVFWHANKKRIICNSLYKIIVKVLGKRNLDLECQIEETYKSICITLYLADEISEDKYYTSYDQINEFLEVLRVNTKKYVTVHFYAHKEIR